jgi:hypothetical protein
MKKKDRNFEKAEILEQVDDESRSDELLEHMENQEHND